MKVRLHADPFVDQLASLCRAHVTRSKWVFVPSHAIGRTLGERVALGGTNWLNLRFVTPLDIALRTGAPFLVERDIGLCDWIETDFSAGHFRRLLQSGEMGVEAEGADPDESDDDRVEAKSKAELSTRILDWINGLIAAVPQPDANGEVPLQAVVEGV